MFQKKKPVQTIRFCNEIHTLDGKSFKIMEIRQTKWRCKIISIVNDIVRTMLFFFVLHFSCVDAFVCPDELFQWRKQKVGDKIQETHFSPLLFHFTNQKTMQLHFINELRNACRPYNGQFTSFLVVLHFCKWNKTLFIVPNTPSPSFYNLLCIQTWPIALWTHSFRRKFQCSSGTLLFVLKNWKNKQRTIEMELEHMRLGLYFAKIGWKQSCFSFSFFVTILSEIRELCWRHLVAQSGNRMQQIYWLWASDYPITCWCITSFQKKHRSTYLKIVLSCFYQLIALMTIAQKTKIITLAKRTANWLCIDSSIINRTFGISFRWSMGRHQYSNMHCIVNSRTVFVICVPNV